MSSKKKIQFSRLLTTAVAAISVFFLILSIILFFRIALDRTYFSATGVLDKELAANFGTFFQGLVGTTAGIAGSLLIVLIFLLQYRQAKVTQLENSFYKMLDYHRDNVGSINISDYRTKRTERLLGQRAFVVFKLQLFECLKLVENLNKNLANKLSRAQIIDVAYMVFYYGIGKEWEEFSRKLFKRYSADLLQLLHLKIAQIKKDPKEPRNLGRTNQTALSAYFRNMYNAILLVHNNHSLSRKQKNAYIKVLRSQLTNTEQAILYFNVMSRFGKKWKENNLICEYELIKNLPSGYCGKNYDFKQDFKMDYEDDEIDVAAVE